MSDIKVLFLGENLSNWVYTTLYEEQQAIIKQLQGGRFFGPGYEYNNNQVPDIIDSLYGDTKPDAIFCYVNERRLLGEPLAGEVIRRYGIPADLAIFPRRLREFRGLKICWINDFWHCSASEWEEILLSNDFQYAFSTYAPPFSSPDVFKTFFSEKVRRHVRFIPWPRAINPLIFFNMNLEKTNDIALLGAMDAGFYPLRNLFHQALKDDPDLRYFHRDHPGYVFVDQKPEALAGVNYVKAINQSKIFVSCTGKYRIPFIKLYEITACGAPLACDEPWGADHLGLKADENFIKISPDNFKTRLREILMDPDKLNEIGRKGYENFQKRHTVDIRAREFVETISAIISGKPLSGWAELSQ